MSSFGMSKGLKQNKRNLFLLLKFFFIFVAREKSIYSILNFNVHATVDLFRHLQASLQRRISKTFHERNFLECWCFVIWISISKEQTQFLREKKKSQNK